MGKTWERTRKPRLTSGAWSPAELVLLLLRPGVDEAAVQRRGVLGGGALGVPRLLRSDPWKAHVQNGSDSIENGWGDS